MAIDFEYAGLDDPAKTLADFSSAKVRVDVGMFDQVASRMAIAVHSTFSDTVSLR